MDQLTNYSDKLIALSLDYAPRIATALVVLVVGLWIVGLLVGAFRRMLAKRSVDASLQPFLTSLFGTVLKLMLAISVAGMLGIEMTSFIAVLGAAGLAIGMALSGTLQNFAGGVMILLFKPFRVGDFVSMQGFDGVVKEIQIFNTVLTTGDNRKIILPNAPIASGSLVNFSAMPTRRVDLTFQASYQDDIDTVKETLHSVIAKNEHVLADPAPFVAVLSLGDSAVNYVVRVWVNAEHYWPVFFYLNETVKKTFDQKKISIPFPQMQVHIEK